MTSTADKLMNLAWVMLFTALEQAAWEEDRDEESDAYQDVLVELEFRTFPEGVDKTLVELGL